MDFQRIVDPYREMLAHVRRDLHRIPEIGFSEEKTSRYVAEFLRDAGLKVETGIARYGVVGHVKGAAPGPTLMIRSDMDGLPISEETELPFASTHNGMMHACGHDGHTAVGLTVAQILEKHKDEWAGTVKLVFQPAEEGLGGARAMVKDGVLTNPVPDFSLGMHVWNDQPTGKIAATSGPMMAAAEMFRVTITGKGAHGASPHLGKDPILAAAQIITALQSVVSRNVDPLETAVVSITAINGGTAFNVIPPAVELKGTIRTYLPEIREMVLRRVEEIIQGVAEAMQCTAEVSIEDVTPAVINDSRLAKLMNNVRQEVLPGTEDISGLQTMGSEDMAYLMDEIPGCYIFVGSKNEEKDLIYGHHHPKFDFDEQALLQGVALISASAVAVLNGGVPEK